MMKKYVPLLAALALFALTVVVGQGPPTKNLTLAWDPHPANNIVSFKLYEKYAENHYEFRAAIDSRLTSITLSNVPVGKHSYVLRAIDTAGLESLDSNVAQTPTLAGAVTNARFSLGEDLGDE